MECPGETFCCPPRTTCGRDSTGSATCLNSNGSTTAVLTATGTSSGNGNGNNKPNTNGNVAATNTRTPPSSQTTTGGSGNNNAADPNPFNRKNAALPQAARASRFMVTVVFLGAFLVSSLAFYTKSCLTQCTQPALGFCSREL